MTSRNRTALALAACLLVASIGCTRHGSSAAQASAAAQNRNASLEPTGNGYAEAAEGLKVHYEVFGKGDPIVVLAGGFMTIGEMSHVIAPLAQHRQVIGIDLEGHGATGLRTTPMSHQRDGDDVAAVLRHLNIAKADIAGYSHGADAALRMAIQHPNMVRNLIIASTPAASDGWYPEVLEGMKRGLRASAAPQMQKTQMYKDWAAVAPHPEQFSRWVDRMGALYAKSYDWSDEIRKIQAPTLLLFADHDAVRTDHIVRFFALFGGGQHDAGFMPGKIHYARARLAIVPGYTHYNFGNGPDMARVIESYLEQPTSPAKPVNE